MYVLLEKIILEKLQWKKEARKGQGRKKKKGNMDKEKEESVLWVEN